MKDEEGDTNGQLFRQASNLINDADREENAIKKAVVIILVLFAFIICGAGIAYTLGLFTWIR